MIIKISALLINCSFLIVLIKIAMSQTDRITLTPDRNIKNIIINGLEYGLIFWLLFLGFILLASILDITYRWTVSNLIVTMGYLVIPSILVTLGVCWKLGIINIYIQYLKKYLKK